MKDGVILPYLDMPLHASEPVLKRPGNTERTYERIAVARDLPDLSIRSNIITGFPGETEQDFEKFIRVH